MKLAVWMEAKPKRQARMDGWSEEEKDAVLIRKTRVLIGSGPAAQRVFV